MGLLAIAVAPCLAVAIYIYLKDEYEREPLWLLALSYIGGMVSIVPAINLEKLGMHLGFDGGGSLADLAVFSFIVIGLTEEVCKYVFLRIVAYKRKEFNEPYDGIVYAVMVSMGFAMVENIIYVFQHGPGTGVLRMFTAIPAHAVFGVIMGYFIGKAKFEYRNKTFLHVFGVLMAAAFHGMYDFSLLQNTVPNLKFAGAVVSLIIALNLSQKAIRTHQDSSPFK